MRVWDLPVNLLCDKHLRGQHLEIHTMMSVLVNDKKGYRNHPETIRWERHLASLKNVHDQTAQEMVTRGMNHRSPLPKVEDSSEEPYGLVMAIPDQVDRLVQKGCSCKTKEMKDSLSNSEGAIHV